MNTQLNPLRRFFWFLCGVDSKDSFRTLAGPYISERRKYASIGLTMFTMTCLTLFSFSYAFFQVLNPNLPTFHWGAISPWLICFVLAMIVTLIFLNVQRFVLTISNSVLIRLDGGGKRLASGFVGILLSVMMSIAVGVPLQTMILSPSIDASIYANRVSYDLKVDDHVNSRSSELIHLVNRWDELGRDATQKTELLTELPEVDSECELDLLVCLQTLKTKFTSLGDSLESSQKLPQTDKLVMQYERELTGVQIVKVQEKLKLTQKTGFLYRSRIGFEFEPFFSWLILLSVMFLQATPGIARMLSQPSAYDYAIIEGDRLLIAKEGIELEADYVFDSTGHKIPVDKFHPAELIYQKEMEQVEQKMLRIEQDEKNIKEKRMAAMSSYIYSPVSSKSV